MDTKRRGWRFLWWLYLIVLFLFVILKFNGSLSALRARSSSGSPAWNLRPFHTLRLQWQYFSTPWGRLNMLGNFLPFLPLGLLSPLAHPRLTAPRHFFLFALSLFLLAESVQLLTCLGSFDVDDILLNLLGAAMGFGLFRLCSRRSQPGKPENRKPKEGTPWN